MGTEASKKIVIPVTRAKPFLKEKLRQIELGLASVQDKVGTSKDEGFQKRSAILLKHHEEYIQIHNMLVNEFKELFKDYTGYEYPPVVNNHPVFNELKKNDFVAAREGQYLLGSLDVDGENEELIVGWCSRLEYLDHQVIGLNQTISEMNEEKVRGVRLGEMKELEDMIQQLKTLIEDSLKFQEDNQKLLNREKRLSQQHSKIVSTKLKELQKKEKAILKKHQKLTENNALLLAREERIEKKEEDLQKNQKILNETFGLLGKQKKVFEDSITKLEFLQGEPIEARSSSEKNARTSDFSSRKIITSLHSLIVQQQKLMDGMEHANSRLAQDKSWIKSLLKGLLDQQEKFQQAENRILERERESMTRKENDLNQERGWSKVDKAKIHKANNQDEIIDP